MLIVIEQFTTIMKKALLLIPIILSLALIPIIVDAHSSGCHRWHSCPSDSIPPTYQCGDTGYSKYCPVKVSAVKPVYDLGEYVTIRGTIEGGTDEPVVIVVDGPSNHFEVNSVLDVHNQFVQTYRINYHYFVNAGVYNITATQGNLTAVNNVTIVSIE